MVALCLSFVLLSPRFSGGSMTSLLQPTARKLVFLVVSACLLALAFAGCKHPVPPETPPDVTAVSPSSITQGAQVTFSPTITGSVTIYNWDFGEWSNPETSSASAPRVTAGSPGNYTGQLTASN